MPDGNITTEAAVVADRYSNNFGLSRIQGGRFEVNCELPGSLDALTEFKKETLGIDRTKLVGIIVCPSPGAGAGASIEAKLPLSSVT